MAIEVMRYTGRAVMLKVGFGVDVPKLMAGVCALLTQDNCAKVDILPGEACAIMLLTEGHDEAGARMGYELLMAPFARQLESGGSDVISDIVEWPKQ